MTEIHAPALVSSPALSPAASPREIAIRAEAIDTMAWIDQYEAAPPHIVEALGLRKIQRGSLAMIGSRIPFSHFNMVLTLGCPAPVDANAFETIEAFYRDGAGPHWIVVNDHSQPADLDVQLLARGYRAAGAWDRVILQGTPHQLWTAHATGCERVDTANAAGWIAFIRDCYGMPPGIGDWLQALVGRKGWIHFLRREQGLPDAKIVMVRSAFIDDEGWCWLGIDAPVPGVMAPCFEDDQKVTAALLLAAADAGARQFVSDIEAISDGRQGPGYAAWAALGFACSYRRRLFRHDCEPR
ncbi:hypothetical protein [Dongia sp.]|uniref:hypothetical protein n=1 Tax=Dongia sp. TaxID=1977262 RepID=UPI0035B3138E